jgi:putative ABC transport system substrate-binding protein
MGLVSRRGFGCILASVALGARSLAIAQPLKRVRRIGWLHVAAPGGPEVQRKWAEPLQKLGWIEGQNLHVERRYGNGDPEALASLAEDLVRARVELILTFSTPATLAARRATGEIPIIFASAGDPVGLGLVASLGQPGSNITGFSLEAAELTAKSLSLLKELIPNLQRIAFLWEGGNPYFRFDRDRVEKTCRAASVEAIFADYAGPADIRSAIESAARRRAQVLVVSNDSFSWDHRKEIFGAATRLGLPAIAEDPDMARESGALIAYTPSEDEGYRVVAEYIDRVLRGARPADLPVRQPTKFELTINLRTARALGISVPNRFLLQADEVIQ